ncbi:hypothetical protein GGE48_006678 [Rhizobium leguminosarum]|nr:hypothetical protein [Rhizobium leguminosarum]
MSYCRGIMLDEQATEVRYRPIADPMLDVINSASKHGMPMTDWG